MINILRLLSPFFRMYFFGTFLGVNQNGAQISPPIGKLQNRYKNTSIKSRFVCTRENFDSPLVVLFNKYNSAPTITCR